MIAVEVKACYDKKNSRKEEGKCAESGKEKTYGKMLTSILKK